MISLTNYLSKNSLPNKPLEKKDLLMSYPHEKELPRNDRSKSDLFGQLSLDE
jgi:hypothetical protein